MRSESEGRKAGHPAAGRELGPEDQIDEIVDHYRRRVAGGVMAQPLPTAWSDGDAAPAEAVHEITARLASQRDRSVSPFLLDIPLGM